MHSTSLPKKTFCLSAIVSWLLLTTLVSLAKAQMVVVTADPGRIKLGNTELAQLPRGTRLWSFKSKDGWHWVKVPTSEQRAWIYGKETVPYRVTAAQQGQVNEIRKLESQVMELEKKLKLSVNPDFKESDLAPVMRECIPLLTQCVSLSKDVYGNIHTETAFYLSKLGLAYILSENHEQALDVCLEAFEIRKRLQGFSYDSSEAFQAERGSNRLGYTSTDSCLSYLGRCYYNLSHPEKADALFETGLQEINKQYGQGSTQAMAYRKNMCFFYWIHVKNNEKAEKSLKETLQLAEQHLGKSHIETMQFRFHLKTFYEKLGKPEGEEAILLGELEKGKKKGAASAEAIQASLNLAAFYAEQFKLKKAEDLYKETHATSQRVNGEKHSLTITTLDHLASFYQYKTFDYSRAESLRLQALKLREEFMRKEYDQQFLNHWSTLLVDGKFHLIIGDLYEQMGRYADAEKYYVRAHQLIKPSEEHLALTRPHVDTNLEALYLKTGEYDKLERLFKSEFDENDYKYSSAYLRWANLYAAKGEHEAAEENLRKAIQIEERSENPNTYSFFRVGSTYLEMGLYDKAEPYLSRTYTIEKRSEFDYVHDTKYPHRLGLTYLGLGKYTKAEPLLVEAHELCKKFLGAEDPQTVRYWLDLAQLYHDSGDLEKARGIYEEALRIRRKQGENHPNVATTLGDLAVLSARQGDFSTAGQLFQDSRQIVRQHTATTLPSMPARAQMAYLAKYDREAFYQSLSLAFLHPTNERLAALSAGWVINGKAIAQEALAESALLSHSEAAPVVYNLRAVRNELARLSLAEPKDEAELKAHREKVADLETRQQQLSSQLAQFGLGVQKSNVWTSIGQVREKLPSRSVLINLVRLPVYNFKRQDNQRNWSNDRYVAWVVPSVGEGDIHIVDLGKAETMDTAIFAARTAIRETAQQIADRGEPEAEKEMQTAVSGLAELALKPLLPYLVEAQEIVISPDSALWLAPWTALPLSSEQYVVEKYQVRFLSSGRELTYQFPARSLIGPPTIMADPDFDLDPKQLNSAENKSPETRSLESGSLIPRVGRLPGTAAEAEAILPTVKSFADAEPQLYLNTSAQESTFKKLHRPRLLVMSTHGFFLADQVVRNERSVVETGSQRSVATATGGKALENPLLRCGLLLAGCNQREHAAAGVDDGVLTGLEIVGTDLRGTEMVVLSACETGLGELQNGEGVAGLRQAFQLAGAESVVSTLWQIPDQATARLMNDFFKNLADGMGKSEALRQAQIARIKSRRERGGAAHPFFWAAFTLTGS